MPAREIEDHRSLRSTLLDTTLAGTFVLVPRIEVIELLGLAGFDFVILDGEHGPMERDVLAALVAVTHASNMHCIVRVPGVDHPLTAGALDAGADGVMFPHVTSAEAAVAAIRATRFPPEGNRGANPYVRAGLYSDDRTFLVRANDRVAAIAMVEGPEGIAALPDILRRPGLDAVFLGPVDLSMALGRGGDTNHPDVLEAIDRAIASGRDAGVSTGVFAPDPQAAARWLKAGARLVALSVDTALMLNGFRTALAEARDPSAAVEQRDCADV